MAIGHQLGRRDLLSAALGATATSLAAPALAAPQRETRALRPMTARSVDGTTLIWDAQGEPGAPEILFIHGLRQSRLSYDRQFADPALRGFRMVRYDLRGHGDSDKPGDPAAYADADRWADDLAAVIAAAGLRRPVLVGWSLGGYVTGAYLRRHGGARLAGINLVDAVTKLSPELLTPLSGELARRCSSPDLAERTRATAEFLIACFHRQPPTAELQQMLVVNGMTARAVNEGFVNPGVTDFEPAFAAYRGPILLTHGARDRLVRVAMSERISALDPRHRLSIYADSGHSPFYEEPVRFGRELAAFVTAAMQR